MQGFRACGREEGGFAIAPSTPSPSAAHKQIRIEKSSHKTHLIQPIRRVRCVSFAKKSAPKKGGIPAGTPPLEALDYTFWKVNTTSPPASGAISSTVVSNS